MSQLDILEYPDPRLRQPSVLVEDFDDELRCLVDDLVETMHAMGGIGLSAPQAGVHRQVLVMDLSEDKSSPDVYVNPQIRLTGDLCIVEESCLSLPGIEGNVMRRNRLQVRAFDVRGERFERELEDMYAVCMQHELDHLAGRLFIDRLPLHRRLWIQAGAELRARRGNTARQRPDAA